MPYHISFVYAPKMGDCKVSCSHSLGRLQEPGVEVSTVLTPRFNNNTHTAIFHRLLTSLIPPPPSPSYTDKSAMAPLTPYAQPPRAMASNPSYPPDIVTNEDRSKPDEVLRVLSPLRPRRTPVLVNAPVVSWHLGASSLRPLPSFDSVLSDSVLSTTSGVSSVGSTVRALRGALRALSGDAETVEGSQLPVVLEDAPLPLQGEGLQTATCEGDTPLPLQGEGLQAGNWDEDTPFLPQGEGLQTAPWEGDAPLPPPHRIPPTLFSVSVTDLGVEREEQASIDTASPSLELYSDEEDAEKEGQESDSLAKPPPAEHQVNGWTPHVLSPVTEVTESGLSRGASMMSMLSLGNALEVGVARRVRFAAVGSRGSNGSGCVGGEVEEEEEEDVWKGSESGGVGGWSEGRSLRRRPAFYAVERDAEDAARRSRQGGGALPREERRNGGCRLHAAAPLLRSSAGAGSDTRQTATGQATNGEAADSEKPANGEEGERNERWRGFCVKLRLDKVREKVGRLRRKLKGRVGRAVATRILGRVL